MSVLDRSGAGGLDGPAPGSTDLAAPPTPPIHRRLPGGRTLRDGRRLYWWAELLAVLAFYFVYSAVRNLNDSSAAEALQHAREIIDLQRALGLFHEPAIQEWARGIRPLILSSNYFYGSLHFIVTGGVMIYLYHRWSDDYPLWRNTIAIGTALALVGFAVFPLMPPRLLPGSMGYGFVDTLAQDPAFWSFNSGAVSKVSNQFAAMPSVHCLWASWCACALFPRLRHSWAKALAVLYPCATVTAIVVTANHYVLDAVAGFALLAVAYGIARAATRAGRGRPTATATLDLVGAERADSTGTTGSDART